MDDEDLTVLEQQVDDLLTQSGATNAECLGILELLIGQFRDRDRVAEDAG